MYHDDRKCYDIYHNGVYGNPPISFDGTEPHTKIAIANNEARAIDENFIAGRTPAVQEIIIIRALSDDKCTTIGEPGNPFDTVIATYNGELWVHDPRFVSIASYCSVNPFLVCVYIIY